MTEYGVLQIQAVYVETLNSHSMNFISILPGYLLACYCLGGKIKLFQFIILMVAYTFIRIANTFSVMAIYNQIFEMKVALLELGRTWESQYYLSNIDDVLAIKYPAALA
ncbi:MAG: hypothetical protein V7746_14165 [Halioglobus sp.]